MADISKITALDGVTYDIKDLYARQAHDPIALATKTYTNVIATANDNNGAGFFYLKYRGESYTSKWHIKVRVHATVPNQVNYDTETIFDLWGYGNTYSWYSSLNRIRSTSYRPIYYNSNFRVSQTGYNNGCGGWLGFNLMSSTNNLNASYKRTIVVDLLGYDGCTVDLQDELVTPTNIPNRASHTDWYASTDTSFDNFDACNYGLKQTGDSNTTFITNLCEGSGNFIADSAIYRYQLLFHVTEDRLTPLNNVSNSTATTKTMLTNVEFDPFAKIYYWTSTTTYAADAVVAAGSLAYSYTFDLRYSLNCGQTLTAHKDIYLVVVPQNSGKVKLSSTTAWTQTLPSTNDGNWYIFLGRAYSTYQIKLYTEHPVYMHDGTTIREVLPGGFTIAKSVPADAVFTDTTYSNATTSTAGLMSAEDKTKLNNVVSTPSVSSADNGKFLRVVNGVWAAATVASANGVDF